MLKCHIMVFIATWGRGSKKDKICIVWYMKGPLWFYQCSGLMVFSCCWPVKWKALVPVSSRVGIGPTAFARRLVKGATSFLQGTRLTIERFKGVWYSFCSWWGKISLNYPRSEVTGACTHQSSSFSVTCVDKMFSLLYLSDILISIQTALSYFSGIQSTLIFLSSKHL